MVSLDQIFDFSFYKKLLKSKGGNLEEEAKKPNNKMGFIKGCGVSIIGVIIVGAICANFVYFSKLNLKDVSGGSAEETIGTYFPIPEGITGGVLVGNKPEDFGVYNKGNNKGNPAVVKPASISLDKFNIPPSGSNGRILGRFPYYEGAFDEYHSESGFFEMRKSWYIRSIAATYIFWRGILQHLFKIMQKCSPGFKLILTLMFLAVFIGGPAMLTRFITDKKQPSSSGFMEMIVFSLMAISTTQIRHPKWWDKDSSLRYAGIGPIVNLLFFLFADIGILTMCGTFTAFAMVFQFILTFIPPFGPFLFNFSGMLSAMRDIKQPLGILFGFFCIVFAQLHLNKAVFTGMTITVMLYILVELNSWRKGVYKSLTSSK